MMMLMFMFMFMFMLMMMLMMMMMMTVLLCFTCGHKEVDFQLQSRGWTNPWNWNSGLANSIVIDMKSSSNSLYFDKNNYFTSCDPHHDIYTCSYWHIFWHSI